MGRIPVNIDTNLKTKEPNLDSIKKPTVSYDAYDADAEAQITADLMDRQSPIPLDWVAFPAQLTPCKSYLMLALIYRAGSKAKGDRHWEMADMYETKYGATIGKLQITLNDGARVRGGSNRLIRRS